MTNEILKSEMATMNNETWRQKFLTTEGHIGRVTYFERSILLVVLTFIVMFITLFFGEIANIAPAKVDIVLNIITLLLLVPNFCLDVKRLHDLGKDSTLAKIFLGISLFAIAYNWVFPALTEITPLNVVTSIASLGFTFYLLFARGEDNDNQYGAAQ